MSCDTFVYWTDETPTREEIGMCLEDYVRGLATDVTWDRDRWFVGLPGTYSLPFARVGPATKSMRALAKERATESDGTIKSRWFEVWMDDRCMNVITRQMDEVTNNIAHGFAELCRRGWDGRLEE